MKLTVYNDGQFWVGVVEVENEGKLKARRHVFGAEPKDVEVLDFVHNHLNRLVNGMSSGIDVELSESKRLSPKRAARLASREMQTHGISTKAQQAVKLELETRKQYRKQTARERRIHDAERKWHLKLENAKKKHRGK